MRVASTLFLALFLAQLWAHLTHVIWLAPCARNSCDYVCVCVWQGPLGANSRPDGMSEGKGSTSARIPIRRTATPLIYFRRFCLSAVPFPVIYAPHSTMIADAHSSQSPLRSASSLGHLRASQKHTLAHRRYIHCICFIYVKREGALRSSRIGSKGFAGGTSLHGHIERTTVFMTVAARVNVWANTARARKYNTRLSGATE